MYTTEYDRIMEEATARYEAHGGFAFPASETGTGGESVMVESGMTLRDWFAGQALCGIAEYACSQPMKDESSGAQANATAGLAYSLADAMLAMRKK